MHTHTGLHFLLALIIGVGVVSYFIAVPFFTPLVLGVVFAVILQPIYGALVRAAPAWRGLAAFITVLFSIFVILGPLSLLGAQIAREATDVYTSLAVGDGRGMVRAGVNTVERYANGYVPGFDRLSENISANISAYAETALQWVIAHTGAFVSGVASTFLSLFIFLVSLFFFLKDGSRIKRAIIEASPLRDTYDESLFDRLELAINSVVRGNLTIAIIQGILTGIGLTIFGVPNSVLWGTVAAVAAMIPALGTGLIFIPVVGYLLLVGNSGAALGVTIWGIAAVGLIDNLLGPRLIGRGVKLHPLVVLISVLGGISLFGAVGVFLGPLTVSLLFALISIYTDLTRRVRS